MKSKSISLNYLTSVLMELKVLFKNKKTINCSTHWNSISRSESCNSLEIFICGTKWNHQERRVCVTQFIALINKSYSPVVIGQALWGKRKSKSVLYDLICASGLGSPFFFLAEFAHALCPQCSDGLPIYNKGVKSIIQTT